MIGVLLALAAVGPVAPDDAGHQTVYLGWDALTKGCTARVGGIEIGDPTTDDGGKALTNALSGQQRAVQLQGLNGVPYTCVDSVLSTLRKAGHTIKVGFLSEPAGR